MVVSQLESYITNQIPEAVYRGNLKELIKLELQHGKGIPTIVIDVSAFAYKFVKKYRFSAGDYQTNTVKKDVEHFVEDVISSGADLIVVLRGNCPKSVKSWFNKKKPDFLTSKKTLDDMTEEKIKEMYDTSRDCVNNTFSSISNKHYKVFTSVEYVHKEVAEIAITQNCFAVIGQDSNYLIYEGIKYYITTKSLNVKTLACKIYDRKKLIDHLGLKSHHLPLFATLCGNDEVCASHLGSFHKKISHSNNGNKFLCISKMVKNFSNDPYKHINDIMEKINHPEVQYEVIKRSLDMYLNFEKIPRNKWQAFADERKKFRKWTDTVYKIFIFKELWCGEATGFGGSNDLLPITVLRPLRQKIYGILFYHEDYQVVTEYCLEEMSDISEFEFLTPKKVAAVEPECQHPGLIQLYDDNAADVYSLKLNLFCSSISTNLDLSLVRKIPPRLLFPILALHYLEYEVQRHFCQSIFKEKFEIESFLVVVILVHENLQGKHLKNYDFKLNKRATSLILNFFQVYYTLKMLNEACGVVISQQDSCKCIFDGILFHYVYEKMSKGTKWCEFFGGNIDMDCLFSTLLQFILKK